jgi:hypothetical protein
MVQASLRDAVSFFRGFPGVEMRGYSRAHLRRWAFWFLLRPIFKFLSPEILDPNL